MNSETVFTIGTVDELESALVMGGVIVGRLQNKYAELIVGALNGHHKLFGLHEAAAYLGISRAGLLKRLRVARKRTASGLTAWTLRPDAAIGRTYVFTEATLCAAMTKNRPKGRWNKTQVDMVDYEY